MPLSKEKLQKYHLVKNNPNLAVLEMLKNAEEMAENKAKLVLESLIKDAEKEMKEMISKKKQELDDYQTKLENQFKKEVESLLGSDKVSLYKGEQGEMGFPGRNGKDGKDGKPGKDGRSGKNGLHGRDGVNGKDGKDGSPDRPQEIATKLNTLTEAVERKVIKGLDTYLRNLERSIKDKGGRASKQGGGMGNVMHKNFSTSSATTTVTTNNKVAAGGNAHWVYYNGQLLFKDTHYTVGSDHRTFTFLITLQDNTNVSILYIRT